MVSQAKTKRCKHDWEVRLIIETDVLMTWVRCRKCGAAGNAILDSKAKRVYRRSTRAWQAAEKDIIRVFKEQWRKRS